MRVLVPDAQYPGEPEFERAVLPDAVFSIFRARDPLRVPDAEWARADAVLVFHEMTVDRAVAAKLARARIVVRHGVGYDNIDIAACAERGIVVCNVPDYGTGEVADHSLACVLALRRGLPTFTENLALDTQGGWRWDAAPLVRRIAGQIYGIVGLGRIGRAAASRARAFGFEVAYFDPYVRADDPAALPYLRFDDLGAMLAEADVVSLHCPLTRETHGMFGAAALARMKPGAVLVNTARGAIVDTDALLAAIEAGKVAGAALDVLPHEPPLADDALSSAYRFPPSWLAGRLILTPHAAFYSPESNRDLRAKAAETAGLFLKEGRLRNCVNAHLFAHGALPEVERT
jgi:phosphoglycerate dehydrogenase-like enzyme